MNGYHRCFWLLPLNPAIIGEVTPYKSLLSVFKGLKVLFLKNNNFKRFNLKLNHFKNFKD